MLLLFVFVWKKLRILFRDHLGFKVVQIILPRIFSRRFSISELQQACTVQRRERPKNSIPCTKFQKFTICCPLFRNDPNMGVSGVIIHSTNSVCMHQLRGVAVFDVVLIDQFISDNIYFYFTRLFVMNFISLRERERECTRIYIAS